MMMSGTQIFPTFFFLYFVSSIDDGDGEPRSPKKDYYIFFFSKKKSFKIFSLVVGDIWEPRFLSVPPDIWQRMAWREGDVVVRSPIMEI